MIPTFIQRAIGKAVFERLENGDYYAEIPLCRGVWATGDTVEACRRELQEVLEDWLLLKLEDGDPLPVIDGIDLNLETA